MTTANPTPKFAVLVSNEHGSRPNFDAIDVPFDIATDYASGYGSRVECAPVGRAVKSFCRPDGQGLVWSIVASKSNA